MFPQSKTAGVNQYRAAVVNARGEDLSSHGGHLATELYTPLGGVCGIEPTKEKVYVFTVIAFFPSGCFLGFKLWVSACLLLRFLYDLWFVKLLQASSLQRRQNLLSRLVLLVVGSNRT